LKEYRQIFFQFVFIFLITHNNRLLTVVFLIEKWMDIIRFDSKNCNFAVK